LEPGSWIWDGINLDLGSEIQTILIRDKHLGSAILEILLPTLLGLKEPNNNQTLWEKGILGYDQDIFTI
jgi:hypothetical protein